jgi:hypothetical protein
LLSLKRDDLVKVLTNPDTEDVDMSFQEQSMNVLTNPDTEDMEMCFPEHLSFHLGGNLYLIAEQDGILLTDKNPMSDIYFPLVSFFFVFVFIFFSSTKYNKDYIHCNT